MSERKWSFDNWSSLDAEKGILCWSMWELEKREFFNSTLLKRIEELTGNKYRADRIVDTVADICYNGAASFLEAAESVCKYNYQHLREHNRREREQLPELLAQYINE